MAAEISKTTPPEAWAYLQKQPQAVLLDVRTSMEYQYVGHPPDAVHVPLKEPPDWQVDSGFVDKVRAALAQARPGEPVEKLPVLAICRSGARSQTAAELLAAAGFENLHNVVEGFEGDLNEQRQRGHINGWRFHNLPWEQS